MGHSRLVKRSTQVHVPTTNHQSIQLLEAAPGKTRGPTPAEGRASGKGPGQEPCTAQVFSQMRKAVCDSGKLE